MIHHIYDHNFTPWKRRIKRINGALTYSQDICQHYLPFLDDTIKNELGECSIVVSTCAPLHKYQPIDFMNHHGKHGVLVQFLHSYPYTGFLTVLQETWNLYRNKFEEIIFVTAYQEYFDIINDFGRNKTLSARFLPMRIGKVPEVKVNPFKKNRAVWFGNIYKDKVGTYEAVVKACNDAKISLITIEGGKINGQPLMQQAAWQIMSDSGIVFGVGRCALEAYSMGCYVIIAGAKFGGTVITKEDWLVQESTNFNGRLHTGHMTIEEAIFETQLAMETLPNKRTSWNKFNRINSTSIIEENGGRIWK